MKLLTDQFLAALSRVLPGDGFKALHEPEFSGNEWIYVKECLDTGWVSSAGKFVDQFEKRLAEFTDAKYAVAAVNGTAALHIALMLAGVKHDEEVIVPALSFVATANAVRYCGAEPHFVDSANNTLGMDPKALSVYLKAIAVKKNGGWRNCSTGRRLAAIVPVHTLGHPVNMNSLLEIANRYEIPVVEDAAESLGSFIGDKHTGTFGLMGILSFNGNKILTTGGGGAILTDDFSIAQRAKHLTTTAKLPHRWGFFHDEVGYNYRMPNINAALGCAQLERLPDMLSRKRLLAMIYKKAFNEIKGISFVDEPAGCQSNFWLNAVLLDQPSRELLEECLTAFNDNGFMTRPSWTLMHRLPMYRGCPRAPLPVAEDIERRLINLPSSAKLA